MKSKYMPLYFKYQPHNKIGKWKQSSLSKPKTSKAFASLTINKTFNQKKKLSFRQYPNNDTLEEPSNGTLVTKP